MKILLVHNRYFMSGGADKIAWQTASLLENKGHQVIPFSMNNQENWKTEYAEYFVNDINYSQVKPSLRNFRTAIKMIFSIEAKRKIDKLLRKTRPHIAHIHNIYGRLTPSILYSLRKYRIPVVMTLHDYKLICPTYDMYYQGKACERCKHRKFYRCILIKCHKNSYMASFVYAFETYIYFLLQTYLRYVNNFIAPSMFIKQKMAEFGIPERKIKYIPNFVEVKADHPSSGKEPYFLYFGKLLRAKGVLTLLEAVTGLPNFSLLIAGDGDLRKEVENYLGRNYIRNVKLLGQVGEPEMSKLLATSKFAVLPSECYENAPVAILEALAYGKPVIASRIGGIPELIEQEKDGLLFEPGNVEDLKEKIQQMLFKSNDELMKMGKAGMEKVRKYFNAELHYDRLITFYKEAINTN